MQKFFKIFCKMYAKRKNSGIQVNPIRNRRKHRYAYRRGIVTGGTGRGKCHEYAKKQKDLFAKTS